MQFFVEIHEHACMQKKILQLLIFTKDYRPTRSLSRLSIAPGYVRLTKEIGFYKEL